MVRDPVPAGNLAPHSPWTIAPMAAIQETMTTRRKAMGTAPMPSSYADDARPPFRRAMLFLLRVYLTPELGGSQLPLDQMGLGLFGSSQVRGGGGGAMVVVWCDISSGIHKQRAGGHAPPALDARRARAFAPALTKRRRRRETVSDSDHILSYLTLQGLTPSIC
jgi:hypothetical protein